MPLSVWFLGIYFITQSKVSVSALSLKRTTGVSYNTALLMKHKIQQVMKERDDSKPLTQFIQVDDAYWGGKKHDGIRGRGATGKIPFIAAVSCANSIQSFCYRFNRRFDLKQMVPRFGYVAVRTPPMPQRLLKLAESHG